MVTPPPRIAPSRTRKARKRVPPMPRPGPPADDRAGSLERLHRELLSGSSPSTAEVIASLTLEWLVAYLGARRKATDPADLVDAAVAAIMGYVRRPSSAHAASGAHVLAYLKRCAWRNLSNIERAAQRRRRHEAEYAAELAWRHSASVARIVELCGLVETGSTGAVRESIEPSRPRRQRGSAGPSDRDRLILAMIECGVRSTAEFAAALGLLPLPPTEQFAAVKREKDRVKMAAKRARARDL